MNNGNDRTIFNVLEKPVSSDWNQAQSQLDRQVREYLKRFYAASPWFSSGSDIGTPLSGFVGDGFEVRPTSPASGSVVITAGIGYQATSDSTAAIDGVTGLDDLCTYKPLPLALPETVAIDLTPPGLGNERWDLIEVRFDRRRENSQPVNIFDPTGKVFIPAAPPLPKTLAFDLGGRQGSPVQSPAEPTAGIGYKKGVVAATGSATIPTVSPGYVRIAAVLVSGAAPSTFNAQKIVDLRPLLGAGGVIHVSGAFTMPKAGTLATLLALNAPPGVKVAVAYSGSEAGALVAVIAGGGDQGDGVIEAVTANASSSAGILNPILVGLDTSARLWLAVDGTAQTNFADPTATVPVIQTALKQRYFLFTLQPLAVVNGGSGAVGTSTVPDPTIYQFSATIRTRPV